MNSFAHIPKEKIDTNYIFTYTLAKLYTKLFREDDFIGECIRDITGTRRAAYPLPIYQKGSNSILHIIERGDEMGVMLDHGDAGVAANHNTDTHDNEPAYCPVSRWPGHAPVKAKWYKLLELLVDTFHQSAHFAAYALWNVMQRATDAEIISCIKIAPIPISRANYAPLYDNDNLPAGAGHDIVIMCPDGTTTAHKLILMITSKLFADVIGFDTAAPIEIKFPFDVSTTEHMLKIIYYQSIQLGVDMATIDALDYTQVIDKSEVMDVFVKNISL